MAEAATTASTPEDRAAAMRAFLQRAEVRLSTLHRVGAGFISGAGLLVLLPVVASQILPSIAQGLAAAAGDDPARLYAAGTVVLLTMALPIYALYLLLRDVTQFYFTPHHPGQPHKNLFLPSFSVAAISYPQDEPGKEAIKDIEEQGPFRRQILSPRKEENRNLDTLLRRYQQELIPKSRLERLETPPNFAIPTDKARLYAALAIAGYADRSLIEETARMELSLARQATLLRRLLLLYVKAFLLSVGALLALTAVLVAVRIERNPWWLAVVLGIVWSWTTIAPYVVARPMDWIYRLESAERTEKAVFHDEHLMQFERIVTVMCAATGVLAAAAWGLCEATVYGNAVAVLLGIAAVFHGAWLLRQSQGR